MLRKNRQCKQHAPFCQSKYFANELMKRKFLMRMRKNQPMKIWNRELPITEFKTNHKFTVDKCASHVARTEDFFKEKKTCQ